MRGKMCVVSGGSLCMRRNMCVVGGAVYVYMVISVL